MMIDSLGWLATAVFVSSYFAKQPLTLRRIQGVAACMWAAYGVLIDALPVVVANLIVAGVAISSSIAWPYRRATRT
jgi:uncharacterized protein with PQ loop repeat